MQGVGYRRNDVKFVQAVTFRLAFRLTIDGAPGPDYFLSGAEALGSGDD